MKKLLSLLLLPILTIVLTACGANTNSSDSNASVNTESHNVSESTTADANSSNHILVAYFSATGNTQAVAERLANGLHANLFNIVPAEPYTSEDLDYNNDASRTSLEMNDPASRPAIAELLNSIEQYDTIFLGYPIWWGDAPRIMSTFMESYDSSGKTIIPFCTSGSSGINQSVATLQALAEDADWRDGQRFDADVDQTTLLEWVDSLNL